MNAQPNRRGVLNAMAAIPALSLPVAAVAQVNVGGVCPELSDAIQSYRRASAASRRYYETVHSPSYDRWQEAVSLIPHVVTANSFVNVKGDRITLTTADKSSLACSRSVLSAVAEGDSSRVDAEYLATLREQVSAADRRDAERDRLRIFYRVDATGDRCDRLGDISLDAIDRAVAVPARSAADLAAKITFIKEMEWWDVPAAHDALSSDARRLAGEVR